MKHPASFQDLRQNKKPKLEMSVPMIKLTASEENLRNLLLDVTHAIHKSESVKEKIILRFAGGWVRDKLLDIPSNDIDVAINTMTGSLFTSQVQEFLQDERNLEKYHIEKCDVGRIYKVEANPERSKHLETSTMNILGYDVDFVNLRKETYSDKSRNPTMEFGTPEEDALRRDCTINALFYNIHTNEVEDYTGGLKDIASRLIRTPVDPKTTFMDDPLRILRLIRFSNRLNFVIDAKCEECMSDPEVLNSFHQKISRERVLAEVFKMIKGDNPRGALEIFHRLGLYHVIFTDGVSSDTPIPDISQWKIAYNCLQELVLHPFLCQTLIRPLDETVWILAAYVPWSTVKELPEYVGKTKLAWGAHAARVALRLDTKNINLISGSLKNCQAIFDLKNLVLEGKPQMNQRDYVANLIRGWNTHGDWRLQVVFAIMTEATRLESSKGEQMKSKQNFSEWVTFIEQLERLDVMNAPLIKNKVDGRALGEALGLKPGRWMAKPLEICMDWTLRNPNASDTTEIIEELKKRREELKIPPH